MQWNQAIQGQDDMTHS